jgi:formimidoylglutamate deiminase
MSSAEQAWWPDLIYTDGRLLADVVLVANASGKIVRLSRDPTDRARAARLPGRALLPGFVNVHSHSFQRTIRGRTEYRTQASKDTFWTWREKMYHAALALTPEGIYATARMCFLEMALAGITTVGEFHYLHHAPDGSRYADPNRLAKDVVRAAREVGLRIALLQTGYARAGWQREPNPGQIRFLYRSTDEFLDNLTALRADLSQTYAADEAWVGVAPHSLRAVTFADFKQLKAYATTHHLPVHMHMSEQRAENEACQLENRRTPIALLATEGLLDPGFTAIHAVHVTPDEIQALGRAGATVCACPTTERNLGDGIVAAAQMFTQGVHLATGSDSQTQIAPLEDVRQLEYHLRLQREERAVLSAGHHPDDLSAKLLDAATAHGARSLFAPGGTLAVGRSADFVTVDLRDPSLAGGGGSLATIVFGLERTAVRDVVVGGKVIVRDGRHSAQEAIVAEFEKIQGQLWSA